MRSAPGRRYAQPCRSSARPANLATGDVVKSGNRIEQRGLAATRGTDDDAELARCDLNRAIVHGQDIHAVRVVNLRHDGNGHVPVALGSVLCLAVDRDDAVRVRGGRSGECALVGITEVTELQRLGRVRRNLSRTFRTSPVRPSPRCHYCRDNERRCAGQQAAAERLDEQGAGQVDLLKQLTDELMDLALIESGQAPIRLVSAFAVELVNDALVPLRPQAEPRIISIKQ